jgi:hypothetical protein
VINLIIANVIFTEIAHVTLLSPTYLWLQILQMSGLFVFVIQKRPQDLFSDFSKRPDLMFSIFQYPRD